MRNKGDLDSRIKTKTSNLALYSYLKMLYSGRDGDRITAEPIAVHRQIIKGSLWWRHLTVGLYILYNSLMYQRWYFLYILIYWYSHIKKMEKFIFILIIHEKFVFRIRNIYYNPNAHDTNDISIFLKKQVFRGFFKDYWCKNLITCHFIQI